MRGRVYAKDIFVTALALFLFLSMLTCSYAVFAEEADAVQEEKTAQEVKETEKEKTSEKISEKTSGNSATPKTGDTNNIGGFVIAMLVSFGALAAAIIKKKKRNL